MSREQQARELVGHFRRIATVHGVPAPSPPGLPNCEVTCIELRPGWTAVVTKGRAWESPATIELWKNAGVKVPELLPNMVELWVDHQKVFSCEFDDDLGRVRTISFRPGDWHSQLLEWAVASLN